ncbi:MAG: hypothetical protein ACR5LA_10140 [Wolbachia sp.]
MRLNDSIRSDACETSASFLIIRVADTGSFWIPASRADHFCSSK